MHWCFSAGGDLTGCQTVGNKLRKWSGLWTRWIGHPPRLLLYQMGKTGSQTLEATLRKAAVPHRIWRGHFLSPAHQSVFNRWLGIARVPEDSKASLRAQIAEAKSMYREIDQRRRRLKVEGAVEKLEVVAAVRDPVGVLLASICQNFTNYFDSITEIRAQTCRDLMLGTGRLGDARRQQIKDLSRFLHDWFDLELKGVLGIDVYSIPFEHANGCAVYENDLARVLVYRYEDFSRVRTMLETFLGRKLGALVGCNIGSQKVYGAPYESVKQNLELPVSFLAEQYDSPVAQHFYTAEERQWMCSRWGMHERRNALRWDGEARSRLTLGGGRLC
jgi:hypothetical protein